MQKPPEPSDTASLDTTVNEAMVEALHQRAEALGLTLTTETQTGVETNTRLLMSHHANLLTLMALQTGDPR